MLSACIPVVAFSPCAVVFSFARLPAVSHALPQELGGHAPIAAPGYAPIVDDSVVSQMHVDLNDDVVVPFYSTLVGYPSIAEGMERKLNVILSGVSVHVISRMEAPYGQAVMNQFAIGSKEKLMIGL
ncbi:hypothetical protein BJV82DRAFT_574070 [Fennellomyces sp. T-0311]|nr:hypothetical protein BJV82DRAFT_574070 [Fennellomyces sp. T-0311]